MNIPRAIGGCVRLILLARLVWAGAAAAQIQNGQIVGLVTDVSGAVLSNAVVNTLNLGTSRKVTVRSNATGLYAATQLMVGTYILSVSANGFAPSTSGALTVKAGTVLRVDFTL